MDMVVNGKNVYQITVDQHEPKEDHFMKHADQTLGTLTINRYIKEYNKELRIYFHSRASICARSIHSGVIVSDSPCSICNHPRCPWFRCSLQCQRVDWVNRQSVCDSLS